MYKPTCFVLSVLLAACSAGSGPSHAADDSRTGTRMGPFCALPRGGFNEPWAMAFLPDGNVLLTEKPGTLRLLEIDTGRVGEITGVPAVVNAGQGGLGDIALHPHFEHNQWVYFSYAQAGEGNTAGAAVARARLQRDAQGGGQLEQVEVIWRQVPKVSGRGHYAHRLVFDEAGYLWVSSGERQKFDPAQEMDSNLGKVLRLHDDGRAPADNPFAAQGGIAAQIWSLGHRNPLGLAFDRKGRPWDVEMGPKGGDELNLVERGGNYGYPLVSNGDHYDGRPIPNHDTRPEFIPPKISWTPVISPSRLAFYTGNAYPHLAAGTQHAFISGLSSQSLVHVEISEDDSVREAARYPAGRRIRSVVQGPDGLLWLLEDGKGGRLLQLKAADKSCP